LEDAPHCEKTPSFKKAVIGLAREQRANAGVEFALIATPLFLLLFGIMEMGRGLWLANALHYSVEEAARCASNNTATCGTASQIQSFASARSGVGFSNSVFTATTPACGNLVTASYPINLSFPTLGTYSITLQAQSCFAKQKP
jgi:Flp pilus assembly protein TadG